MRQILHARVALVVHSAERLRSVTTPWLHIK